MFIAHLNKVDGITEWNYNKLNIFQRNQVIFHNTWDVRQYFALPCHLIKFNTAVYLNLIN